MEKKVLPDKYMHISIDDVNTILRELTQGNYNSIYDHRIFNFFKNMHDTYGAVFSLYCYYENQEAPEWTLENMTDKFKDEFSEASHWLRFGFHSYNSNTKYNEVVEASEALSHYKQFIYSLEHFAGLGSIDTIPRIHFFAGTLEQSRSWRDTVSGVKGFLSADDSREVNGYLNASQRKILENYSFYFEEKEELYFFKTNLRLEKVADSYKALEDIKNNNIYVNQQNIKIIFTHECYLSDDVMLKKIEDSCKWAKDNNFTFAYPMEFL